MSARKKSSPTTYIIKLRFTTLIPSDTLTLNLRNKLNDSLIIKSGQNKTLKFGENFLIEANLPFQEIDKNKISIINKDSLKIDFQIKLDTIINQYNFLFDKEEEEEYSIELLPGALTDFYENQNDTLFYRVKTRTYNDYGNLSLNLRNAKFPMLIELLNPNGDIKHTQYITNSNTVDFTNIDSGKYYIRIVFDENENQKYDSGNFLLRIDPEKVIYYPDEIDVRAGWDLVQEFILQ